MTDFAEGYKDFVAWHDGMTVSDLPVSNRDACRILSSILSMATFNGGFSAISEEKTEIYFNLSLPDMLTTENDGKELLLKLNIDELKHASEQATEEMLMKESA